MKVRAYSLRMDGMEDTGEFTGYASIFGNVDWYGTVVDKGAFKKTINDNGGKFPLLFFHDPTRPIGMVEAEEDNRGLKVRGRVDLDTPDGRLVYRGLKGGYIDRMSIGFDVIVEAIEDETPHYKEVRLWEASLITRNFAANEEALVEDVRAAAVGVRRINRILLGGVKDDLHKAVEDLRALLAPLDAREYEYSGVEFPSTESVTIHTPGVEFGDRAIPTPDWAQEIMEEIKRLRGFMGESQSTPSGDEPLTHSDLLKDLRELGKTLKTV